MVVHLPGLAWDPWMYPLGPLEAGANIEAVDRLLEKPLHAAAESGRIDCLQLLLEHNADVNEPQELGEAVRSTRGSHGARESHS